MNLTTINRGYGQLPDSVPGFDIGGNAFVDQPVGISPSWPGMQVITVTGAVDRICVPPTAGTVCLIYALSTTKTVLVQTSRADAAPVGAYALIAPGAYGFLVSTSSGWYFNDLSGGGSQGIMYLTPTGVAATDTARIQSAISAMSGKGEVWLMPGMNGLRYAVNATITLPNTGPNIIRGVRGQTKIVSTVVGVNPYDAVFYGHYTATSPANAGTLAADVKPGDVGANAVNSHGTAPPAITLSYTAAPNKASPDVKAIFVRATLGGNRGVWTGEWTAGLLDSNGDVVWHTFLSAATVAMAGTNLTLNIANTVANVDNRWDVAGPCSISMTGMTAPAVGQAVLLSNTGTGSGTSQELLNVIATQSSVAILNEPIVMPFVTGDSVTEVDSYPIDNVIEGIVFSGTGGQSIEFVGALRPIVRECEYRSGDGVVSGSWLGFDCACRDALADNCTSQQPNGSGWIYFQSNVRGVVEKGLSKNCGYGVVMEDSWQVFVRDHWMQEMTAGGIQMIKIDASTPGCDGCQVSGGGFKNGVGNAVEINDGRRCSVSGFDVDGATIGYVVTTAPNTSLTGIKARNCTASGVQLNTGSSLVFVNGADIEVCDVGLRVNPGTSDTFIINARITACITNSLLINGDTSLVNSAVDIDTTSAANPSPITHGAGKFFVSNLRVSCTKDNASVIDTNGGTFRGRNIVIATSVGANQTGIYVNGTSHAFIEQSVVTGTGANSSGVDSSGANVRLWLGDGNDFATNTNPVQVRNTAKANFGTFTSNGVAEVTTTGWFPADATISLSLNTVGGTPETAMPYFSASQVAGTFKTKSPTAGGNGIWNWRASGGSAWT